jgi:hypothetical protein
VIAWITRRLARGSGSLAIIPSTSEGSLPCLLLFLTALSAAEGQHRTIESIPVF